jgi:hypothetical protein
MYAIELDGRHVGLTLRGHKLGTSKGKRIIREVVVKTVYEIRHTATKVRVVERKRIKNNWGGFRDDYKTTIFALNDEVEIEGESIAN